MLRLKYFLAARTQMKALKSTCRSGLDLSCTCIVVLSTCLGWPLEDELCGLGMTHLKPFEQQTAAQLSLCALNPRVSAELLS